MFFPFFRYFMILCVRFEHVKWGPVNRTMVRKGKRIRGNPNVQFCNPVVLIDNISSILTIMNSYGPSSCLGSWLWSFKVTQALSFKLWVAGLILKFYLSRNGKEREKNELPNDCNVVGNDCYVVGSMYV